MNKANTTSEPVDALLDDIVPVIPYVGQWVIHFCVDIGVAVIHPLSLYRRGRRNQSLIELAFDLLIVLTRYPAQFVLTTGSLVLNAIASLINNTLMQSHERALSRDERRYLQAIFGNNVDYDAVRIQFGGMKEALQISPQAVGNDIFIREFWGDRTVYPDWTLTTKGLRLLGHEVAHVWQYQHTGAGYIGDSLITQVLDVVGRKLGHHFSDGYDLKAALKRNCTIAECNVEQQAVMAELIGASCVADSRAELTIKSFNQVSGYKLNENEFASVKAAWTWFKQRC